MHVQMCSSPVGEFRIQKDTVRFGDSVPYTLCTIMPAPSHVDFTCKVYKGENTVAIKAAIQVVVDDYSKVLPTSCVCRSHSLTLPPFFGIVFCECIAVFLH